MPSPTFSVIIPTYNRAHLLPRVVDAMIVHCLSAVPIVTTAYRVPPDRARVIPLGNYGEWEHYQSPTSKDQSRLALGMATDKRVLLFFGAIREYKGLDTLFDTFSSIACGDAQLVVVGNPRAHSLDLVESLRSKAEMDSRVIARFEFVSDNLLVEYLSACDLVSLPYIDALTSSAVSLAAARGRCAIAETGLPPRLSFRCRVVLRPWRPSGFAESDRAGTINGLLGVGRNRSQGQGLPGTEPLAASCGKDKVDI